MKELSTRLSLLSFKSVKTGQSSYLRSLLSFPSHRCTQYSSLITLSRPSLTSRLKIEKCRYFIILLLFCGTICRLIYVMLLITSRFTCIKLTKLSPIRPGHDVKLHPYFHWYKLTYLVLTCRKTPINQSINISPRYVHFASSSPDILVFHLMLFVWSKC